MKKEKGWISIDRAIMEHFLYKEKRVFSKYEAWIDILLNVNHTDAEILIDSKVFKVKRGESLYSLDTWAGRWNWNKSKVRRFLKLLQECSMVVTNSELKTTRLTVCKYDSYQGQRNADETQMKRKRNADETQATPNNNDNNDNNEKEGGVYRKFNHLSMSVEEYKKLEVDYHKQQIDEILDRINNYSKNNNYKSLYLTAKKWLEKDFEKKKPKKEPVPHWNQSLPSGKDPNFKPKHLQ